MNKTDMSNPDQYSLSGSLCCTKEADKLRHATRDGKTSGNGAWERGGGWFEGDAPGSGSPARQSGGTAPRCFEPPENS